MSNQPDSTQYKQQQFQDEEPLFQVELSPLDSHNKQQQELIQNGTNTVFDKNDENSLDTDIESTYHSNSQSANQIKPFKRNLGNTFCFIFIKGEPLIVIGPHWPFFMCMQLIFIVFGLFLSNFIKKQQAIKYYYIALSLTIIQCTVYTLTALVNPGVASSSSPLPEEEYMPKNYCKKCRVLVTNDMFHCYDCQVCIRGYDHHCIWTGKCIGQGNIWWFYIFLVSTVVYFVSTVLIAVDGLSV